MTAVTAQKVFSYQQVDGLEAIYIGTQRTPTATFVFETADKAKAPREVVTLMSGHLHDLRREQRFPNTDNKRTDLLEVVATSNLSPVEDARVVSCYAITSETIGKPITTVHELLDKVGTVIAKPSNPIRSVHIYGVDSKY